MKIALSQIEPDRATLALSTCLDVTRINENTTIFFVWHCLLSSDFVKNFASRSPSICSERLSLSLFELDRATSIHLSFFFFLSYRATSEDVELRSTKAYAISDTYEQTILYNPTTAESG